MFSKLKPKSEFSKNVLTLMTGTTIAQAIPIAISPILTRIYTPEDFGVFALYMSIVSIVAVVATGRYEMAIMLPKKDSDAANIVALSIMISFFVSFISLIVVFIFNTQIVNFLGNKDISNWLYFIPVSVLLTGFYQSFNYWSNRKKQYKRLATSRVVQSTSSAVGNLSMGFNGFGSSGLVLGQILGQSVATSVLGKMVYKEDKDILKQVKKLKIFALARKYIQHPKYLIISHGISSIYLQIPIFFLGRIFDMSILGFYSLANRFINLPGSLIATSIGEVFRQKATQEYHKNGKFDDILLKTLINTFKLSIVPFLIVYFSVEDIFIFVFGKEWEVAGAYAQILIIGAFFSFVITPVDKAALITNNVDYILKWHIGKFVSYIIFSIYAYKLSFDIKIYLYGLVSINIFFYMYDLYKVIQFSKRKNVKK